ncbi:flagellar assembly protein A [uncultured Desulfobacter sp.]|uniref:flagellar assembly protein A n=1 Tax=uncultured Desulfobacter sp. TaxID=240139 RepID=UPI002AABFD30|nr:flagellar assembly protein A [uncultured Desulfobacter sp.]
MSIIERGEQKNKIIVIDPGKILEQKTGFLSEKGYQVDSFKSPEEGLRRLAQTTDSSYFLIIEGYVETDGQQESLLVKAKAISPDTQRLLVTPPSELPSLVNAINSVGIHACMPLPFTKEDLFFQVRQRHEAYETGKKSKNLQKTIQRQNKQLFQIAGNLRKKEAMYMTNIQQKNKEIRVLQSKIKSIFADYESDNENDLRLFLEKEGTPFNSFGFRKAFDDMKIRVKDIFSALFLERGLFDALTTQPDPWDTAIDFSEYRPVAGLLTKELLNSMLWKFECRPGNIPKGMQSDAQDYFTLELSDNMLHAHIRLALEKDPPKTVTIYMVEQFLHKNEIVFGIVDDSVIREWIYGRSRDGEKLLVAVGKPPVAPIDGEVHYYFATNFRRAGRLNADGSIDYKDRGEIPHVKGEVLLASKVLPVPGTPGLNVKGMEIPVTDPVDPAFSAGSGTKFNEDKTKIFSTVQGEPHLDVMGVVSVNKEFQIKGDVGYETGNINFDGNVIVPGTVKEGFTVKCVSLTAKEISGAHVDISGDLNVSMGIVDSELVNVKGNIQAMYIRNSKINAFGDLTVQKEIIDSTIYLSGACDNERGTIINSTLSAKLGIKARTVGNESSGASSLTVGVDEQLTLITAEIQSKLTHNRNMLKELESEISQMKEVDKWLHGSITGNAQIQDRSQLAIRELEETRNALEKNKDEALLKNISAKIRKLEAKAKDAEKKITEGFERQDQISSDILKKEGEIKALESSNKHLIETLENLEVISNKSDPVPQLTVSRHIQSQTKIRSLHSYKILEKSYPRCTIREKSKDEGGIVYYIMEIF